MGGVRVLNDIMVVRAYGGDEAWKAEDEPAAPQQQQPAQPVNMDGPVLPAGFGVAGIGKSAEDAQKEMLALELSKATRLTLHYSGLCLEQVKWDLQAAALAFEEVKVSSAPPPAIDPSVADPIYPSRPHCLLGRSSSLAARIFEKEMDGRFVESKGDSAGLLPLRLHGDSAKVWIPRNRTACQTAL